MKNNLFTPMIRRMAAISTVLILFAAWSAGCSKDDTGESGILNISDVVLPEQIDTSVGGEIAVSGKGFKTGDVILLRSALVGSTEYTAPTVRVSASEIVFTVPDGLTNGEYKVYVLRNDQRLLLGRTTINLLSDVPDQAGMNVKGIVSCGGQPVAGVVVSDGTEVTKTDAKGIYYLNSDKKNGYVFISVPSGYEVEHSGTTPQFFRYLNQPASTVEQRDFPLTKRDNDRHRVVVFTDVHLANRVSDRSQFQSGFLREMTDYLQSCRKENIPVYGIALGDLAWDSYWYDNNYDLSDYQNDLKSLDFPVFSAPGNHDNDPQIANNDFEAAAPFRQIVGPTDFSFNIGGIHYILLDNVVYENAQLRGPHRGRKTRMAEKGPRNGGQADAGLHRHAHPVAHDAEAQYGRAADHGVQHRGRRTIRGVSRRLRREHPLGTHPQQFQRHGIGIPARTQHRGRMRHVVVDGTHGLRRKPHLPRRIARRIQDFRGLRTTGRLVLQGHRQGGLLPVPHV